MPVYWSLLAWSCFVALTYKKWFLVRVSTVGGKAEAKPLLISYLFAFLPLVIFMGLRGSMMDTPVYVSAYKDLPTDLSGILNLDYRDKFFYQIAAVIKAVISDNVYVWFVMIAVFQVLCLCITIRKYSQMPGVSFFFFIASTGFSYMCNGTRQFVSIMLLFWGFDLLVKKKYFWYILLIVLAAQFHGTAYIMLVGLLVSFIKPWSRFAIVSIGVFTVAMVFLEPILSQMQIFLEDTEYINQLNSLLELDGVNYLRAIVAGVPCAIGFVFRNNKDLQSSREYRIAFNMAMLNLAFLVAASIVGGNLMARLAAYYSCYLLLVYPFLFKRCFREGTERTLAILVFALFYTVWFWFQMKIAWGGFYASDVLNLIYWG